MIGLLKINSEELVGLKALKIKSVPHISILTDELSPEGQTQAITNDVSMDVSEDVSSKVASDISSDDFSDFDCEDSVDTSSDNYSDISTNDYSEDSCDDCYGRGGNDMETYDSYAPYSELHFTETDDRYMDEQSEITDSTNESDAHLANIEFDEVTDALREKNNEAHRHLDNAIYNSCRHYRDM